MEHRTLPENGFEQYNSRTFHGNRSAVYTDYSVSFTYGAFGAWRCCLWLLLWSLHQQWLMTFPAGAPKAIEYAWSALLAVQQLVLSNLSSTLACHPASPMCPLLAARALLQMFAAWLKCSRHTTHNCVTVDQNATQSRGVIY